jgi:hypothetical protein
MSVSYKSKHKKLKHKDIYLYDPFETSKKIDKKVEEEAEALIKRLEKADSDKKKKSIMKEINNIRSKEYKKVVNRMNHVYNLSSMTTEYALRQFDLLLDYVETALIRRKYTIQMLSVELKFKINEDGEVYSLPPIEFMYMLMMISYLLDYVDESGDRSELTPDCVFIPGEYSVREMMNFQNRIYRNQYCENYNYKTLCHINRDLRFMFDKLCNRIGHRLMLSLSYVDLIELMKQFPRAREIMLMQYPMSRKMTPQQVEETSASMATELFNIIESDKGNVMDMLLRTGANNKGQAKEFLVMAGNKPDLHGNTIAVPALTNTMLGYSDIASIWVDASGGRLAEAIKLKVSEAGAFELAVVLACSTLKKVDVNYVCNSIHYYRYKIKTAGDLNLFNGRFYLKEEDLDDKKANFKTVNKNDTSLLGETLWFKTPVTCTHPDYEKGTICRGCYSERLSMINEHMHIGLLAGYVISDDIQQLLLSAKHQLTTLTKDFKFNELFERYFMFKDLSDIVISKEILENVTEYPYALYFNKRVMSSLKDKGGKKQLEEITMINTETGEMISITEMNDSKIFMSPELMKVYKKLDAISDNDDVLIDLIDLVKICNDGNTLFNLEFRNTNMTEPIIELQSILKSTKRASEFDSWEQLISHLIPLLHQAGIKTLPSVHLEIFISRLLKDVSKPVFPDWTQDKVDYQILGYTEALKDDDSPVLSLMHTHLRKQLQGYPNMSGRNLYDKAGSSIFDAIVKS